MNLDDTLKQLDQRVRDEKRTIDLGQSLTRLLNNRDFKKVILDGYLKEEAIRLVSVKQAPNVQSKEAQESILRQIDAIGCFQDYLREVERQVQGAIKSIEDAEELREALLAEEAAE